jgi:maltose O-acetyltransferase
VTEREKMVAGQVYDPLDPDLVAARARCEELVRAFNAAAGDDARRPILAELFGEVGPDAAVMPPLACDYGFNVRLAPGVFVNYGAVFLDPAPVTIGERAQLGPGVQILTADHPTDPAPRRAGVECAAAIEIGANAWIGGGAIVCPGVSIGSDSVIGAGSVVTRDVPAGVVAVGNPCQVIRAL